MAGHEVRIAEFKARLSEHLRRVRRGQTLTLLDRDTPVARVVPYETKPARVASRKPLRALHDVRIPPPLEPPVDSLAALREERQSWR